ncbi:hypothetical protein FZ983_28460 [Azospirillum sp. B21]|nr:hypothetical protein FZ983_28460 [Azospirillum sp. B21]
MNAQPISDFSPSPPRGEGRGEGDALRGFGKGAEPARLVKILAARPPHPNPLPGGERGSLGGAQ